VDSKNSSCFAVKIASKKAEYILKKIYEPLNEKEIDDFSFSLSYYDGFFKVTLHLPSFDNRLLSCYKKIEKLLKSEGYNISIKCSKIEKKK